MFVFVLLHVIHTDAQHSNELAKEDDAIACDSVMHWSSLQHKNEYWNMPKGEDEAPFMKWPWPNTCSAQTST